ncbi:MAG: transporter substrate-binding domain-containing protein [Selenomonadaceae bacterium]|nr:transporter substrate-binding domain-containing protein [Selenomonadaceae bacterium]
MKKYTSALLLLPVIMAILVGSFYLYASEVWRPQPKVEVRAENRYAKTLRAVANKNYAPFSYIDENGANAGLDVELMNELANRLNLNLDLRLLDWAEANREFLAGEADVIVNMDADMVVNNPAMIATLPIAEKQYVVYGKQEISSVSDLYGRRVASQHRMPGLGLDDEITYLDSYEKIFEELKQGEFEFALCPIQVGNSFLEELDMTDIKPSYAVLHIYSALALHPKDTVLCVRLSAMLRQMQQEGRLDELDRKWISNRYANMTILGMLENNPWLGSLVLAAALTMTLLFIAAVFQYRSAKAQAAYAAELR